MKFAAQFKSAFATMLFVFAFPAPPYAQEVDHTLGQHPAVLVKRAQPAGYDYAAHFYPHPAWMYLETDHHTLGEHPAVLVKRREAAGTPYDYAAQFYAHPAGLALETTVSVPQSAVIAGRPLLQPLR